MVGVGAHGGPAGRLGEDFTVTSFENLDLLITDRGLDVDQAIDTLVTIAEPSLLRAEESSFVH